MSLSNIALPSVIDIRVNGTCDLRCPFCFGPRHEELAASKARLFELVPRLYDAGVRMVVITGGEPTLIRWLPEFLEKCREARLTIVLSTNGIRFRLRIEEIAPLVDWVALPLDGASKIINESLRIGRQDHFGSVLDAIAILRRSFPRVRVKLGTVVAPHNASNVPMIPEILGQQRKPDIWKIYQIAYSSYAADNRSCLTISDTEFEQCYQQCCRSANLHGIRMAIFRRAQRDGSYLFCEPNGDAMIITKGNELVIGNFFTNFVDVGKSWKNFVDIARLSENIASTYPQESDFSK